MEPHGSGRTIAQPRRRTQCWSEFNGYKHAFEDPWGNELILWGKAGANPEVRAGFTREYQMDQTGRSPATVTRKPLRTSGK